MTDLAIPEFDSEADALATALGLGAAGWYVGPLKAGTKEPGSVLGKGWPAKTSRDPETITGWFTASSYGLYLHPGRSGAVVLDVDHPENLPDWFADLLRQSGAPLQATRKDDAWRGHYVFAMPAGRRIGNGTGRLGKSWGDVRGVNGIVVVAPTVHALADEGGHYSWKNTGPVPELPAALADQLPDADDAADAVSDKEVKRFRNERTRALRPRLVEPVLADFVRRCAAGESRHEAAVIAACWAARESLADAYPAADALDQLEDTFVVAMTEPSSSGGRKLSTKSARAEFDGIAAWAVAQAEAEGRASCIARVRRLVTSYDPDQVSPLGGVIEQLRTWLDLPDPTATIAALAVAVTAHSKDGEPAWLLLVAAPSGGKTEIVNMVPAAEHLDEVTVAGLLSWTKRGKLPVRTGVLERIGPTPSLVTFGDLSTLLASSDVGKRDVLFATLRRVYDGALTRNVGAASGAPTDGVLTWHGRISVVGAVTGAIDSYSNHAAALGARWLYCRMPDRSIVDKRRAVKMARAGKLAENREQAAQLAEQAVALAREQLDQTEVPDKVLDVIEDAAMVCCYGRAAVPRHGYGRREIDGVPVVEEPPRLIRQLTTVARGALALGCTTDDTAGLVRSVALDSMPATRRAVLKVLATGKEDTPTTAAAARAAGLDRKVCRRTLEDLEAVGAVVAIRHGDEPDDDEELDRRPCTWALGGEVGPVVLTVFDAHEQWAGWADFQVPNTPSPSIGGENGSGQDEPLGRDLNLGTPLSSPGDAA